MQQWIVDELQTVDLPDRRLNGRLALLLDRFSRKPQASFPQALKGRAELEAAYRFFGNPRTPPADILAPHYDATLGRIRRHPVALLAQDTSEIDLTRPREVVGGPLSDAKRTGLLIHPVLAFSPDGLPLGCIHLEQWSRDFEDFGKGDSAEGRPIEEKESYRWLEGFRQACRVAAAAPDTEIICISDSEGDVYEALQEAYARPGPRRARFIVRACQDRCLAPGAAVVGFGAGPAEPAAGKLFAAVAATGVLALRTIRVSRRVALPTETRQRKKARPGRVAEVSVRAARLTLRGPARPGGRPANQEVHAVLVREEEPPAGQEAVEWLLLTDLPINTAEEVVRVVASYGVRWQAEVFFRVLKGGCRVEQRQLEDEGRYATLLAVYLIVAWRVLYLTLRGRQEPDVSCEVVFDPEEWRAAYTVVQGQAPRQAPRLGEMTAVVAELGGYIRGARRRPPGPKVMWLGLQRLADIVRCWHAFGPGQKKNKQSG
jgi:hypothetical protein